MPSPLAFSSSFAKRMTVVALLVGAIISLVPPAAYFSMRWYEYGRDAAYRGEEIVRRIRSTVRENPALWYFSVPKFISLTDEAMNRPQIAAVRIYDAQNTLIFSQLRSAAYLACPTRTPISYNNEIYGYIEIEDDISEIIEKTFLLTILFLSLGIISGNLLYRYPVGIIRQTEQEVRNYDGQARRQADTEIARLERLSIAGRMAAGIGHEIRNPLTTVRGYLQLLLRKNDFSPYANEFQLMLDELDRANHIITEYLFLAHNRAVTMKKCHLPRIIESMLPLIQSDANMRGLSVDLILDPIPDIIADENEIKQLILNIVRNGLESMSKGRLTIATELRQQTVALKIVDQGTGIAPAILEQLGTPFVTSKETGTGLGLPVCYSIASRHKAKIDFTTSPEGTTCTISFPHENCFPSA